VKPRKNTDAAGVGEAAAAEGAAASRGAGVFSTRHRGVAGVGERGGFLVWKRRRGAGKAEFRSRGSVFASGAAPVRTPRGFEPPEDALPPRASPRAGPGPRCAEGFSRLRRKRKGKALLVDSLVWIFWLGKRGGKRVSRYFFPIFCFIPQLWSGTGETTRGSERGAIPSGCRWGGRPAALIPAVCRVVS